MEKFQLHILGCGSAKPTTRHFPSAQALTLSGRLYLIDCGEGAQLQMQRAHLKYTAVDHIFISHLHGDHCFGLIGFISTLALHGRTQDLHVYSPDGLEQMMKEQLAFFVNGMTFEVVFHAVPTDRPTLVMDDGHLRVTTIPLRHRVPTCGYLFEEVPALPHIRRDMIDYLGIPHYAIRGIKEGNGWTTEDGRTFTQAQLTTPAAPPRSYAYVSDTAYHPAIAEQLSGVNLLYHEATFAEADSSRATVTCHSTARQAAQIAKASAAQRLVIGHFSSRYDDENILLQEAREVFPQTELACELRVFEL